MQSNYCFIENSSIMPKEPQTNLKSKLEQPSLTKENEKPLTKQADDLLTKEQEIAMNVEEVSTKKNNLEETTLTKETSPILTKENGDSEEPNLTKYHPASLTKEKVIPLHEKNYAESAEVEEFIQHLGQSEPGSALKMIETDVIIVFDKDTYEAFSEKYQFLLSNHELLGRLIDVVNPILLAIFEKTAKLQSKNKVAQAAFMTQNIGFFMDQGVKINELLKEESIYNDFMAFKALMQSLAPSNKESTRIN